MRKAYAILMAVLASIIAFAFPTAASATTQPLAWAASWQCQQGTADMTVTIQSNDPVVTSYSVIVGASGVNAWGPTIVTVPADGQTNVPFTLTANGANQIVVVHSDTGERWTYGLDAQGSSIDCVSMNGKPLPQPTSSMPAAQNPARTPRPHAAHKARAAASNAQAEAQTARVRAIGRSMQLCAKLVFVVALFGIAAVLFLVPEARFWRKLHN